jgi:hypothetical protein
MRGAYIAALGLPPMVLLIVLNSVPLEELRHYTGMWKLSLQALLFVAIACSIAVTISAFRGLRVGASTVSNALAVALFGAFLIWSLPIAWAVLANFRTS